MDMLLTTTRAQGARVMLTI